MDAYTLKEKKDTQEFHLFKGRMTTEGCTSNLSSICKEMTKSESSRNIFSCKDEDDARVRCATIGRQVCGTCVSHLYESYNK